MAKPDIIVTHTYDLLEPIIEGNDDIQSKLPLEFIDQFILKRSSLQEIGYIYIHLYEESHEYPLFFDFGKSIIHDPMKCKVSDILCSIIFKIANHDHEDYFRNLINRIVFVSQNNPDQYVNVFKYYDTRFIHLKPGQKTSLSGALVAIETEAKKNPNALVEDLSKELYQVLKEGALYYHP